VRRINEGVDGFNEILAGNLGTFAKEKAWRKEQRLNTEETQYESLLPTCGVLNTYDYHVHIIQ